MRYVILNSASEIKYEKDVFNYENISLEIFLLQRNRDFGIF